MLVSSVVVLSVLLDRAESSRRRVETLLGQTSESDAAMQSVLNGFLIEEEAAWDERGRLVCISRLTLAVVPRATPPRSSLSTGARPVATSWRRTGSTWGAASS